MYGGAVRTPRRSPADGDGPPRSTTDTADLNEIVAYNFRRARELRGWTQEETAARLEPFLGQRLRQAAISAIEGAYGGERRREFDAQEVLAFACAFDLPLLWFYLPPPGDRRRLHGTSEQVDELYLLALGREDQLPAMTERLAELGHPAPDEGDTALERTYGAPTDRQIADYRRRRKELLLALLDEHADAVDASAEELGRFFDHLRQVGIRGFVAERMNDPDYTRPSTGRAKPGGSRGQR